MISIDVQSAKRVTPDVKITHYPGVPEIGTPPFEVVRLSTLYGDVKIFLNNGGAAQLAEAIIQAIAVAEEADSR